MDKRREVARVLQRIAFVRELLDPDPKLAKEFASAAWTIRQLRTDLETLHASGELKRTPGIRKAVREVVEHVLAGTPVPGLAEMEERVPPGLFDVRKIQGLGPVKIKALWQQLGITSLGELEYACNENRLTGLKGFGAKTQDAVRAGIAEQRKHSGRFRQDQIREIAAPLVQAFTAIPGVQRVQIVGDTRRGVETVASLDLLVLATAPVIAAVASVVGAAGANPSVDVQSDDADSEVEAQATGPAIVDRGEGEGAITHTVKGAVVRVHVCSHPDRFGAQSVWLTGSDAHAKALSDRAAERGMRFDETGLFESASSAWVSAPDDDAVYAALGVLSVTPERREAGIALLPAGSSRPRLVRRDDLIGALHNHTTASDGVNSLEEMRAAAIARGLQYLAITEHSRTAFYAKGLEAEALLEQRRQVARMNEDQDGARCVLLQGVESDILGDGSLDYDDAFLAQLDVVIASVHARLGQKRDEMTTRMVAAARQRRTHVIGHPTGRLLLGRAPTEYDIEAFLQACAESGCAIELNCNPARLDFNEIHVAMARERGIPISIAADAHSADALSDLEYGILIARRAGLRPDDVLNCKPLADLQTWLRVRSSQ